MRLRTIASLAILFTSTGFVLFLFGLFTQNYNWLFPIVSFLVGIVLYFVAMVQRSRLERQS
jgi:uncharacterized membrane protein